MKLAVLVALPVLAACASVRSASVQSASDTTPEPAGGRANRIALYAGQRMLDEDDFDPVEDQGMLGIEFAHEAVGSAVGFELGLMGSNDEGSGGGFEFEATTSELYAGLRKSFGDGAVHPYLGGGLSVINLEAEVVGFGDDDDTSPALYVHGGVAFDVTEVLSLGIDLRLLAGSDMELAGVSVDADYTQFAFLVAFAF